MIIEDGVLKKVDNEDIVDGILVIPEGVTTIGFRSCIKKYDLIEVVIPESVTKIEAEAFGGCYELVKVAMPNGIKTIESATFASCKKLTEITMPQRLNEIKHGAFIGCESLSEVDIPETVTAIGARAFSGCKSLTKITIPEGITTIGDCTFQNCDVLTQINIPQSVVSIGKSAFEDCRSLYEIVLPENLASIAIKAFKNCISLTEIAIPKAVTTIERSVFEQCARLEKVLLPQNLKRICEAAFSGCAFAEIELPENLEKIDEGAFNICVNLKRIEIPENTRVGLNTFYCCYNLDEVTFNGETYVFSKYEKANYLQGAKIDRIISLKNMNKYYLYEQLELLKEDIPEHQTQKREKLENLITIAVSKTDFSKDIDEEFAKAKQWVKLWLGKDFIPTDKIFTKIPLEKIEMFDKYLWFKLAKEPVFNISEESKMALVELAYVFGIFEKEKYEIRGKDKTRDEITEGDRRTGNVEDYQKRIQQILRMVHEGKLNNENLHMMFDGTTMDYSSAFYRFFLDNEEEIFSSPEKMRLIPKIQREMSRLMKKFDGRIPTIEECERYFDEVKYEKINPGNLEFAKLCKCAGIFQETFEKYQELYEQQKKRERESTIPQIQGENYRILDLADPKALLIGEGGFSKCCQKLNGAGEECMRHSVLSENGRLFEVFDDDGTLLAQSWMWRNGNVVCFDSIEANAIAEGRYSEAEKEELIEKVEQAYRKAAKHLIEEAEKQIKRFREKKLREIEEMEISEDEKMEMRKELERICEESRIKRVTVGKGSWSISQKISDRFSSRIVDTTRGRVNPREFVNYLNDSEIQYIVEESEDTREIRTTDAQVGVKFRDRRRIKKEQGYDISDSTIQKIKLIEIHAHKSAMRTLENVDSITGLGTAYATNPESLRIIHGEDWYYIYSDTKNEIHVYDLARGVPRVEDEQMVGTREIGKGLDMIIEESIEADKPIVAELREDTSYIEFLELMRNGYLEQIGEDVAFKFGDEYGERQIISQEKQEDLLSRREEIRERASNEETTIMHSITFRPTEKYKKVLERRKGKEM